MKRMVESNIDMLGNLNEKGEFLVTEDFKAKFYKFIVDHYLRKFSSYCFCLHLTYLTIVFDSPTWGFWGPCQ